MTLEWELDDLYDRGGPLRFAWYLSNGITSLSMGKSPWHCIASGWFCLEAI